MNTTSPRNRGSETGVLVAVLACALALGAGTAWLRMRSGALTVEALRHGEWCALMTGCLLLSPVMWRTLSRQQRWWNVGWLLYLVALIGLEASSTVSQYLAIRDTPLAVLRARAEGTVRVEEAYATTLLPLILLPVLIGMGVVSASARSRHYLRSLGGWMLPLGYLVAAGFIVAGWQIGVLRRGPVTAVAGVAGLSIGLLVAVRATVLWLELEADVPR